MIPFNKPYMTGKELSYISEAHFGNMLAGDGPFTERCHSWLEKQISAKKALLTHSCTAALEISSILADLKPGDEIIMPSYTFVSTANAFVLRGATPVFVDIRQDTLNIDETKIEHAITSKTKAIVPVHYAGVGCEMDRILAIAKQYNLLVIEDAAQGIMSSYHGKQLGSMGHLSALSFHETKNITCGQGGALLVNDEKYESRAEIIREKGTNRSLFFRGQIDKYTWCDIGSSYLPGEMNAAFLWAQMEEAVTITEKRLIIWNLYHDQLKSLENKKLLIRPTIPTYCKHNAHMYYIIVENLERRTELIQFLKVKGVNCVFHYVPLHSSLAGKRYSRVSNSLEVTDNMSARLIRLPLWIGITPLEITYVCDTIKQFYELNRII